MSTERTRAIEAWEGLKSARTTRQSGSQTVGLSYQARLEIEEMLAELVEIQARHLPRNIRNSRAFREWRRDRETNAAMDRIRI